MGSWQLRKTLLTSPHVDITLKTKAHATILKMGGGHIREAARFTITLGANKISNFKGKWLGNDETIYYFEW